MAPGLRPLSRSAALFLLCLLAGCDTSSDNDSSRPDAQPDAEEPPAEVVAGTYTLSVVPAGLQTGQTVLLSLNGDEELTIRGNSKASFAADLDDTANYAVELIAQSKTVSCTVENGTGSIAGSDVDVRLACEQAPTFSLSGTANGIGEAEIVTVQLSSGEQVELSSDGPFTFPATVFYPTDSFSVTALGPDQKDCQVSAGEGTFTSSDITGLRVDCEPRIADPQLVTDLNATFIDNDAFPEDFTVLGDGVLFSARTDATGRELHISDGTENGTRLVTETVDGPQSTFDAILLGFGNRALFTVAGDADRTELWVTTGRESTTARLIDDVELGSTAFSLGTRAYFTRIVANDAQLWVTDGTQAGTQPVFTAADAPRLLEEFPVVALGDQVLFLARQGPNEDLALFQTDGTEAGTRALTTPPLASSAIHNLVAAGTTAYFLASTAGNEAAQALYRTDGTTTELVADLTDPNAPAVGTIFDLFATEIAGQPFALLSATDGVSVQLYSTRPGPDPLTRIELNATGDANPGGFIASTDAVFFNATVVDGEAQALLSTDGTPASTAVLAAEYADFTDDPKVALGDRVLTRRQQEQTGAELWSISPGSSPELLRDLNPGEGDGVFTLSPGGVIADTLYFAGDDGTAGVELWKTTGFSNTTEIVANLDADERTVAGADQLVAASAGGVVFSGCIGDGCTLHHSAGTEVTTRQLLQQDPTAFAVLPEALIASFPAIFNEDGDEEEAGSTIAVLLSNASQQLLTTGTAQTIESGDGLALFEQLDDTVDPAVSSLYLSDGTTAGTFDLSDALTPAVSPTFGLIAAVQVPASTPAEDEPADPAPGDDQEAELVERVLFAGRDEGMQPGIYALDRNARSAELILPAITVKALDPRGLPELNGQRLFTASAADGSVDLWITDGTTAGTQSLVDFSTLASTPNTIERIVSNGSLAVFETTTDLLGTELWVTDGTTTGTQPLIDRSPGPTSSSTAELTAAGERFFFVDGDGGLWTSDGTTENTQLLRRANGEEPTAPRAFVFYNDRYYFIAESPSGTTRLWVTDGTSELLQVVTDSLALKNDTGLIASQADGADALYLIADDGILGFELYEARFRLPLPEDEETEDDP